MPGCWQTKVLRPHARGAADSFFGGCRSWPAARGRGPASIACRRTRQTGLTHAHFLGGGLEVRSATMDELRPKGMEMDEDVTAARANEADNAITKSGGLIQRAETGLRGLPTPTQRNCACVVWALLSRACVEFRALRTARLSQPRDIPLLAWRARNLFEITLYSEWCRESDNNIDTLWGDAGRDLYNLYKVLRHQKTHQNLRLTSAPRKPTCFGRRRFRASMLLRLPH